MKEWYEDFDNCISLARALEECYEFRGARDVINFFEKTWKWEKEWLQLVEARKQGLTYSQYLDYLEDMENETTRAN
jgi:hypothetical protein